MIGSLLGPSMFVPEGKNEKGMRTQAATSSLRTSHPSPPTPPTSWLVPAHSLGCFVWSVNNSSEETSGWLGGRAKSSGVGRVASIAATSGICDWPCMERSWATGPGHVHGRSGEEQRFSKSFFFLLWPEGQVLRGNNLTQGYMCSHLLL